MKKLLINFALSASFAVTLSTPAFSWVEANGTVGTVISWESEDLVTFAVGSVRCAVPTHNSVHLSQVMLAYSTKATVKVICHDERIEQPAREPYHMLHKIFLW